MGSCVGRGGFGFFIGFFFGSGREVVDGAEGVSLFFLFCIRGLYFGLRWGGGCFFDWG